MSDAVKTTKKSGRNIFGRISKFFKTLGLEMKKVVWPTREQLISSTISVLVFVFIVAALITILDTLVGTLIIRKLFGL